MVDFPEPALPLIQKMRLESSASHGQRSHSMNLRAPAFLELTSSNHSKVLACAGLMSSSRSPISGNHS